MTKPFLSHREKVILDQKSSLESGLAHEESVRRKYEFGPNEIETKIEKPVWLLYAYQYKNPLIFILLLGACVSWFTGHVIDSIAIFVIVLINTFISFWQELKARRSMDALKEMASPEAMVKRDGEWKKLPAKDLVPGDIIQIHTGDIVPADIRMLEVHSLSVDEAALTGESEPVDKQVERLDGIETTLAEQNNMAFMTTIVVGGTGIGIVTATGMQTEVGHIAELMDDTQETKSPMQRRLDSIGKVLMIAALGVVSIVCLIGVYYGMPWPEIVSTGISLSVAAIPEGLPTVVTIVLTLGATKMAKSNALAKQLSAIETLGSTTIICSDKTGTLTENQMQVTQVYELAGRYWDVSGQGFEPIGSFIPRQHTINSEECHSLHGCLTVAALCNDATLKQNNTGWSVVGNPTEGALLVAAKKLKIDMETLCKEQGYRIVRKFPFDSARKMASCIVQAGDGSYFLAIKGAPDVLKNHCDFYATDSGSVEVENQAVCGSLALDVQQSQSVGEGLEHAIDSFGVAALRTLAVGYRPLSEDEIVLSQSELEKHVHMLGIFGIMDPPRKEVPKAIEQCFNAGVRTVMITGDHASTAASIAKKIGVLRGSGLVVTGAELNRMSDDSLRSICEDVAVFARVTPEHKLRIVKALQARNEVVAMTGDGVNDAPALRKADIGVAMGIAGTSVAKESGDLLLLDDNFNSIVKAVRQGRRIFDNLRKFIRQALTANVGEVSVILIAFLVMGPEVILPLTPLMILWINLVSDGLPALALGLEPEENNIMKRTPRKRDDGLFSNGLGPQILVRGLALGTLSFTAFWLTLDAGLSTEYAQTIAFLALVFGQLWHLFDSRTLTTLYRKNPFSNRYLLIAVALSASLSLAVVYTGFGNLVFNTVALEPRHLVMVILGSALPTLLLSAMKESYLLLSRRRSWTQA